MLKIMRKHSQSFLIYLIFGAIIVVFAVNFGPGSSGCLETPTNAVAQVNGESIKQQEFAQQLSRRLEYERRRGTEELSEADHAAIRSQVLQQLIYAKLLAQEAERRGLRVSDEELLHYLKSQYGVDKVSYEIYESWVRRSFQTSVSAFEEQVRRDVLSQKLQQVLFDTIEVSMAELREEYAHEHDRASVTFVKFDPQEERAPAPTPAAVSELVAQESALLEQRYQANKFQYMTPKELQVRHILRQLAPNASAAEVAKARGLLLDLKSQIEGGADFAALAKLHSQDSASAAVGGTLPWFAYTQQPKPLAEAAFALQNIGELTAEPVRTSAGLHLLQLQAIKEPVQRPFDDAVKAEVAQALLMERTAQGLAKAKAESFLAKLKAGKALTSLAISQEEQAKRAGNTGVPVRQETPWILRSEEAIASIGVAPDLHEAIFSLTTKAPLADRVFTVGQAFYVVQLKEREEPNWELFATEEKTLRTYRKMIKASRASADWLKHLEAQAKININASLRSGPARRS